MIPFLLIGGPFDGAEGEGQWEKVPAVLWARHDPNSPGPQKGIAGLRQRPGAVAYSYADNSGDVHKYVFDGLSDLGWDKITEQVTHPVAA